jgi:uncharacterized protein (DUF488 family)
MEFFTIGVYKSNENTFFRKLIDNRIDTFCDIRQRRGVRGSEYAFVNSNKLQAKLNDLEIKYGHILELAPTTEIRELQKSADSQVGEHKRDRNKLGKIFTLAYKEKIIKNFDFNIFIEKLEQIGALRIVLFCVEEKHEACHRSLVSEKLKELGYKITHL